MEIAKVIWDGEDQIIQLPETIHIDEEEVYIKKTAEGVLLIPRNHAIWDEWKQNLLADDNPIQVERNQPKDPQIRPDLID